MKANQFQTLKNSKLMISTSVLTASFIFSAALILLLFGCGNNSGSSAAQPGVSNGSDQVGGQQHQSSYLEDYSQLPLSDINAVGECNLRQQMRFNQWRFKVKLAHERINMMGDTAQWYYEESAIQSAAEAVHQCDSVFVDSLNQPCKVRRNPYSNRFTLFDALGVQQACMKPISYLKLFNLRPKAQGQSRIGSSQGFQNGRPGRY